MDNQHRQIKGYNELTQSQIDLMNAIKAKGQELETLCAEVYDCLFDAEPGHSPTTPDEYLAVEQFQSAHNFYVKGKHDLQLGLMQLTRAVARPSFF